MRFAEAEAGDEPIARERADHTRHADRPEHEAEAGEVLDAEHVTTQQDEGGFDEPGDEVDRRGAETDSRLHDELSTVL